jgi:hypothetical protein
MVSVSVNGWPRAEWTPDVVALADRVIASVLEGCGEGEDRIEDGWITRIARRQCTDAERRRVTEKYLRVR